MRFHREIQIGVLIGCLFACTPTREAATTDIVTKKSKCFFENLNRTPEEMLLSCAVPKDSSDWKNLYDLIVGAQVAAINAGAQLPNAHEAAGLARPAKP